MKKVKDAAEPTFKVDEEMLDPWSKRITAELIQDVGVGTVNVRDVTLVDTVGVSGVRVPVTRLNDKSASLTFKVLEDDKRV